MKKYRPSYHKVGQRGQEGGGGVEGDWNKTAPKVVLINLQYIKGNVHFLETHTFDEILVSVTMKPIVLLVHV